MSGNERLDFMNLKNRIFAKYEIIYDLNDSAISNLSELNALDQFHFLKFSNQIQQMNLVMIDSALPGMISILASSAFINGSKLLIFDTICSNKELNLNDHSQTFLNYKLQHLFYHYLYSNVASLEVFMGDINGRNIYCVEDVLENKLKFYSIYDQRALFTLAVEHINCEVDFQLSMVTGNSLILHLRIFYCD